jgi:hypothetical protein
MTEKKFQKGLKPKIKGTLNLHILSKDMKFIPFKDSINDLREIVA